MEMKNENLKFYTTEKQSEKLLNAGLPANSADCYFGLLSTNPCSDNDEYFPREIIIRQNIKQLSPDFFETEIGKEFLPCWSFGKLMNILGKCFTPQYSYLYEITDCYDCEMLIDEIISRSEVNQLDFEKLKTE